MKFILVPIFFLFAACAPKAVIVPPYVPTAPVEKREEVAPIVDDLRDRTAEADARAAAARARLDAVSRESRTLREGLESAVTEADRLRKQKTATEEELTNLWASLQESLARNLFLEKEAEDAVREAEAERLARVRVSESLARLQEAARQKDAEAAQLRRDLDHSQAVAKGLHLTAADAAGQAQAAQAKASAATARANTWFKLFLSATGLLIVAVFVIFQRFF